MPTIPINKIPDTIQRQLATLRRFNRRVDRLKASGFAKRFENDLPNVTSRMDAVSIESTGNGQFVISGRFDSEIDDFNQDEIDAFVLTYRIFTQRNDALSLASLAAIFDSEWMPSNAREEFELCRSEINEALDSGATIIFEDYQPSVRFIVDTIIYGGLAHTNEEKAKIFEIWQTVPARGFIWAEFFGFAVLAVSILDRIRRLNEALLQHVETYGFEIGGPD